MNASIFPVNANIRMSIKLIKLYSHEHSIEIGYSFIIKNDLLFDKSK
jgi:hypothetical protein